MPHKKKATNCSVHDFFIILYLINQRVFIVKTNAWVCWKGILLQKLKLIKNATATIGKKIGLNHLKWNCLLGFFIF
jgi:hypothetical protein